MLYSIEVGSPSQLDQILRVNKRIFKDLDVPELKDKDAYIEIFEKKKHLILNVLEGKMIIGNTLAVDRNKNYHLWALALNKDVIKYGIGNKILDMHKKLAKEGGFKAVTINVFDSQHEIIKLLEDAGFEVYRKNQKEGYKAYRIKL